MSGILWKSSMKSSMHPAPPLAITGTETALHTASSISISKPFFTPSVSIELTTTSPAPMPTQRFIHSIASIPVSSRPPLAKTLNSSPTRLMSHESTTHWSPYSFAASVMMPGFLMAPEFTLTLSAPHFSTRSKSAMLLIPPPTVSGMNTFDAVSVRISVKSLRPSALAVMS